MRLVKQQIASDGSGFVTLCPQEPEDMWHVHNLVQASDLLTASAIRRVTDQNVSTGSTSSHRVHVNLTIRVKSLDFDSRAGHLHISGRIARENKHTKVGQHHTLDLEINRNFTLEKELEGKDGGQGWDSIAQEQLAEAVSVQKRAEVVAVVMEEGLANVCFVTEFQTILCQKVTMQVPKKGAASNIKRGAKLSSKHDKGLENFFKTLTSTLLRQMEGLFEHKDSTETVPILLASPGFTATNFLKYLCDTAYATGEKLLQDLVKKKAFVVVHSSSGHLHSLNEVMKSHEVKTKLKNTKYAKETRLMDDLFDGLRRDDGRAWYGHRECEVVVDIGAVGRGGGILIVSNSLFRSEDIATRRRWVGLVDKVRKQDGGEIRILSSDHESGRRLEGLGGIAAILTYPVPDLEIPSEDDTGSLTGDDLH